MIKSTIFFEIFALASVEHMCCFIQIFNFDIFDHWKSEFSFQTPLPPLRWTNSMHGPNMMQSISAWVASCDMYNSFEYRLYFHIKIKEFGVLVHFQFSSSIHMNSVFVPTKKFLGPYLAFSFFIFLLRFCLKTEFNRSCPKTSTMVRKLFDKNFALFLNFFVFHQT